MKFERGDETPTDVSGSREELLTLLEGFDTAMLVTRDAHGEPRARPMALLHRKNDIALWFASSMDAPKVAEIENDPLVGAVCTRDKDHAWVSVSGRAGLTRDRARIKELWSPIMGAWFSGPDDARIVLIRVEPHHAEYYEPKLTNAGRLFEIVRAVVGSVTPDLGPVKHVSPVELNRLSEPGRVSKT